MNSIRTLLESKTALVAVSFYDNDSEQRAKEARTAGVDIAELRIDRFERNDVEHVLEQIHAFQDLPILATVRSTHEGGNWSSSEQDRLELFRAVAPFVDAIDIELSSSDILPDVVALARQTDTIVIVSYHNFEHTPSTEDLESIVGGAESAGADIIKVSTMATSGEDLKTLASLLLNASGKIDLIVIAMGDIGTISRVFFPALGSRLTYSFIGESRTPGQLEYNEASRLLKRFHLDK
jgi:3-dehydroquinate dehydratase I